MAARCEHTSEVLCCSGYIISPSSPSPFIFSRMVPSTPLPVFFQSLCHYIFIYYCWRDYEFPFKWSLDNDLPQGSVEQSSGYWRFWEERDSSGAGETKFPALIPDQKLLWIFCCTNCLQMWGITISRCDIITPLKAKTKLKLIRSCHCYAVNCQKIVKLFCV